MGEKNQNRVVGLFKENDSYKNINNILLELLKRGLLSRFQYKVVEDVLNSLFARSNSGREESLLALNHFVNTQVFMCRRKIQKMLWMNEVVIDHGSPGVTMDVFFVDDQFYQRIGEQSKSQVGGSGTKSKAVARALLKHTWLSGASKDAIRKGKVHAEAMWIGQFYVDLVNYLKSVSKTAHDNFSGSPLLLSGPHIAVYTSSSLCNDCRRIYIDLKAHLEAQGIYMPIIFYASKGTNTSEEPYSISTIVDGEFQRLNAIWSSEKSMVALPGEIPLNMNHFRDQQLAVLSFIGALAMRDILKLDARVIREENISSVTYFAPDLFAIYMLNMRGKFSAMRPYLKVISDFYNEVDLRLLIYWRMSLQDYIHYLMHASRNHRLSDLAYQNSFGVCLPDDKLLKEGSIFHAFAGVWASVKMHFGSLKEGYDRVGYSIHKCSSTVMPYGCLVGPLDSELLRRMQQSPKRSDQTKTENQETKVERLNVY